jgi:hypothetical protein
MTVCGNSEAKMELEITYTVQNSTTMESGEIMRNMELASFLSAEGPTTVSGPGTEPQDEEISS